MSVLTALRPGATAGRRVDCYYAISFLAMAGVLLIFLMLFGRMLQELKHVAQVPLRQPPCGVGMALVLVSLVFIGSRLCRILLIHWWHFRNDSGSMLIGHGLELACFLLILPLFLRIRGRAPLDWSVFGWQRSRQGVWYGALALLCATPLVWLAGLISSRIVPGPHTPNPLTVLLQHGGSPWVLLGLMLVSMILAPLVEETLYRGLLLQALEARLPFWGAAAISGTLFALAHGQLIVILPITVLGIVNAFVFRRTGNLFAAMLAHAVQNGSVTAFTLLGAWALHGP